MLYPIQIRKMSAGGSILNDAVFRAARNCLEGAGTVVKIFESE